jgi:hypothetical protein
MTFHEHDRVRHVCELWRGTVTRVTRWPHLALLGEVVGVATDDGRFEVVRSDDLERLFTEPRRARGGLVVHDGGRA